MSANGSVTISGSTNEGPLPSVQVGPIVINTSAPIGAVTELVLQSGDNAITIPSGTTLVIVQLPATNAVVTTLEGASSGSSYGITMLAAGGIAVFQPASGQTSFYLHAASTQTGLNTVITFI